VKGKKATDCREGRVLDRGEGFLAETKALRGGLQEAFCEISVLSIRRGEKTKRREA